jgi:hypothetical protein
LVRIVVKGLGSIIPGQDDDEDNLNDGYGSHENNIAFPASSLQSPHASPGQQKKRFGVKPSSKSSSGLLPLAPNLSHLRPMSDDIAGTSYTPVERVEVQPSSMRPASDENAAPRTNSDLRKWKSLPPSRTPSIGRTQSVPLIFAEDPEPYSL